MKSAEVFSVTLSGLHDTRGAQRAALPYDRWCGSVVCITPCSCTGDPERKTALGDGPGRCRVACLLFLTAAQLRLWHAILADKGTGKKQDIKITGASTLASDEVDRMVKDAEQYADEDKKQREAVDVKNQVSFQSGAHILMCLAASSLQSN